MQQSGLYLLEWPIMGESYPTEIQLADVLAFNDRLLAMSKASIPVQLGGDPANLPSVIERLNGRIAQRIGRGESMAEVLASEPELSVPYCQALRGWVILGRSMVAAEPIVGIGRWRRVARDRFVSAVGGIWFLWMFAVVGLAAMVANLTPKLRGVYESAGLQPGSGFRAIERVESHLWIATLLAIGVGLVGIILWRWVSKHSSFRWVPNSNALSAQACRAAAASQALAWVQIPHGSSSEAFDATSLCMQADGRSVDPKDFRHDSLLGWALGSSENPRAIKTSLQLVSDIRHSQFDWEEKRGMSWLPLVLYQFAGGLIVLVSGIMLFWPLVELLIAICE